MYWFNFINYLLAPVMVIIVSMSATAQTKPNIVFVLADDLGWHNTGFHGSDIPTPNLDSLAAASVRLENFHVNPMCTPTRASFITGRPAHRLGLSNDVLAPWSISGLPQKDITIAQKLKGFGYRTALIGKWHLGHSEVSQRPMAKGFDYQFGPLAASVDYIRHTFPGSKIRDLFRNEDAVLIDGYLTDLLAQESENVILSHDFNTPLFLYLPFVSPHSPFQAVDNDLAKISHISDEQHRVYAAMVYALDRGGGNRH